MSEPPTILFVEDESAVRDVVVRTLSEKGFRVLAASNARDALRILDVLQIELLFTDIVMPSMDGVELARHAKAVQPDIRILFATGYMQRAVERGTRQLGRVLLKPVREAKMVREIEALLAPR
jgi:two-component system cell cycle response regulator CpdR